MAQLLVRNLDDDLKEKLREQAIKHGRSTEEEVREILRSAILNEARSPTQLGTRLAARFAAFALDEEIPELRGQAPRPVDFDA